jgi:anti-anti-sigma regulatory factor
MVFAIEKTTKDGTVIVSGALTVGNTAAVREELIKALQASEKAQLDLQAVTEIDLSALQLFCSAHKTAIKAKKVFELIDSSTGVAKNTAGLNGYLRQQGCNIDLDETCLWKMKRRAQ